MAQHHEITDRDPLPLRGLVPRLRDVAIAAIARDEGCSHDEAAARLDGTPLVDASETPAQVADLDGATADSKTKLGGLWLNDRDVHDARVVRCEPSKADPKLVMVARVLAGRRPSVDALMDIVRGLPT
jgi:hypothetical protein